MARAVGLFGTAVVMLVDARLVCVALRLYSRLRHLHL
jgi:hypothetical protein